MRKGAYLMLIKKFYIPIALCILAIVAIGIFALRSDTPKAPIKIVKFDLFKNMKTVISATSIIGSKNKALGGVYAASAATT